MSSRSTASPSKALLGAIAALLILICATAPAHAGRRVVVLEFEGPKAERFREDVEAAVAKGNTIVSLDKWTEKADDLNASKLSARNIKKVAKKLKVDGVIVGDIEKRGARYYVHLRLREGISGDYVAEVEIVVRAAKLGSDGVKVIKEELMPAIKELARVGGDDEDDEEADEDDDAGSRKGKKSGFGRRDPDDDAEDDADADDEEDEAPAPKGKKAKAEAKKKAEAKAKKEAEAKAKKEAEAKAKKEAKANKEAEAKKKAGKGDDEDGDDEDGDDEDGEDGEDDEARGEDDDRGDDDRVAASDDDDEGPIGGGDDVAIGDEVDPKADPRFPAIDVSAGMSVTARRLGFDGAVEQQGYKGNPVAGLVVAADVYPLAFSKKNRSFTRNIGLTLLFDRVVKIDTRLKYEDAGTPAEAVLPTVQQRLAVGAIYRHAIGAKLMIEGSVRYNRMKFNIDRSGAPPAVVIQIPSVNYQFIDPGVAAKYLVSRKVTVGGRVGFGLVLGTGEMQTSAQYGATQVIAIDVDAGASYQLADKVVVSADLRLTTFGLSFTGNGALSDPEQDGMVEVPGGRDTYFGGVLAASYLF